MLTVSKITCCLLPILEKKFNTKEQQRERKGTKITHQAYTGSLEDLLIPSLSCRKRQDRGNLFLKTF